jgi:hypothetical protein
MFSQLLESQLLDSLEPLEQLSGDPKLNTDRVDAAAEQEKVTPMVPSTQDGLAVPKGAPPAWVDNNPQTPLASGPSASSSIIPGLGGPTEPVNIQSAALTAILGQVSTSIQESLKSVLKEIYNEQRMDTFSQKDIDPALKSTLSAIDNELHHSLIDSAKAKAKQKEAADYTEFFTDLGDNNLTLPPGRCKTDEKALI